MGSAVLGLFMSLSGIKPFTILCASQLYGSKENSCNCDRVLVCSIANIFNQELPVSLGMDNSLSWFGNPTLLCIMGSRMLFNLKEAAEHGVNVGTNWSSYSHSAILFEEPQSAKNQPECITSFCY